MNTATSGTNAVKTVPEVLHIGPFDLRAKFWRWWHSRMPASDSLFLNQRNVYILPTRAGWMLALTLLVLLVASINYQLNLGYLLTFLIAGAAVVGMHVCHGNLRGMALTLAPPAAAFAGTPAVLDVRMSHSDKRVRYSIGVAVLDSDHWSHADVPAQGSVQVQVAHSHDKRGWHALPMITAQTLFPLGTFKVWTVWRPASKILVYPRLELHPPPLPSGEPVASGAVATRIPSTGEFDGVRAYQRGDPMKLVVWKKAAKSDTLVSRDTVQHQRVELLLDYASCGASAPEQRISRLAAWVMAAEKQGVDYGLRLPGLELKPSQGEAHKRRCLEALATC